MFRPTPARRRATPPEEGRHVPRSIVVGCRGEKSFAPKNLSPRKSLHPAAPGTYQIRSLSPPRLRGGARRRVQRIAGRSSQEARFFLFFFHSKIGNRESGIRRPAYSLRTRFIVSDSVGPHLFADSSIHRHSPSSPPTRHVASLRHRNPPPYQ